MISSFEVGAVFKILDEASPTLRKILAQIRELNKAVEQAKLNIAGIAKMPAMGAAIGEAQRLATAWAEVSKAASSANRAIGRATKRSGALAAAGPNAVSETNALAGAYANLATQMAAARAAGGGWRAGLPPPPGTGGGASTAAAARGRRLAHGGGSGAHIGGPSVAIPGGSHVNLRGGAAAALGLLGYGVYQAMQYDDAVVMMAQHAGVDLAENRDKFRKILTDAAVGTGFNEHDISAAAQQELRMFGDTGGSNGVNVLPKMLRYAATEARLKGTSLEESMSSLTGLAHMLQKYGEDDVDKIAPAFSALSTRNPMSLAQQERAFGYAVPLLHSSLGIDPFSVMAGSTALARAGITNTKGGTWLRELAVRAMPGTSLMSKMAFKKHEEALKAFGLVDENHNPTWFTDGHGDFMKLLKIASEHAANIPMEKRASYERQLFGAQGSGALAVLSEPAVRGQMGALYDEMNNPQNVNRVRNFMSVYNEQSSLQNARTAIQDFNVTLADIGANVLPSVNHVLHDFKSILENIRGLLPKLPEGKDSALIGGRAIEGALIGGGAGLMVGGPAGAAMGAAGGGVLGTAAGFIEQYNDKYKLGFDKAGTYTSPGKTGKPAEKIVVTPPVNLSLNIDGRTLAQVIADKLGDIYKFDTSTAAANGASVFGP